MKKCIFFFLFLFSFLNNITSQIFETLKLTPEEAEARFLQENLLLIANKYDIEIADAMVIQAKLWENPSLSVDGLSFWSTDRQREGVDEVIPPLFGNFAKNTQFSVEVSQLIQLAGKRSKLVNREKISREIAMQEFEELLRGLKTELRKTISELIYLQSYSEVLNKQQESLSQMIAVYRKQVSSGNFPKSELLRLESSLLELQNEENKIAVSLHEQQRVVKGLLNIDPFVNVEIERTACVYPDPEKLTLSGLLESAYENRPDLQITRLQTEYFERSLAYEKSLRVPDLTVSVNYDRAGGVWKDFVGIGLAIDIPLLNRNQGNIQASKAGKEQSINLALYQQNVAGHEITESFQNYITVYNFYKKIIGNNLLTELDAMLDIYTKNFMAKNIGLLEYIDFIDTYKRNKETVLAAQKDMDIQFEELQYVVGASVIMP